MGSSHYAGGVPHKTHHCVHFYLCILFVLNKAMTPDELIFLGNDFRSKDQYDLALKHYAQAFVEDRNNIHAWNNYGNVLREIGEPKKAIPFLQHAIAIDPDFVTAHFNLAVAYLLDGQYTEGWDKYEWRWRYEHLNGTLPKLTKPRWTGQSLNGKTVLVISEQGFGDCIQFARFFSDLIKKNASIKYLTMASLTRLFTSNTLVQKVTHSYEAIGDFDYWIPMMSLPSVLNVTFENLAHSSRYIQTSNENTQKWRSILGPKKGIRIGICYSGRRDNWVNKYKGVPIAHFMALVQKFPDHEWINLQVEPANNEEQTLKDNNVRCFDGMIQDWHDTAGLLSNLDIVISIDTSVAHLAGAMSIPTYIPLTKFAVDWRWGLMNDTTPWYPTVRLFRQEDFGNWTTVFDKIANTVQIFKL